MQNTNEPVETAENQSPMNQEPRQFGGQARTKNKLLWWVLGIVLLGAVGFGGYWYGNQKANIKNQNDNSKVKEIVPTTQTPSLSTNGEPSTPTTQQPSATTPDPTASWKTYENINYNYLIKYPNDFKLMMAGEGGEPIDAIYKANEIYVTDNKNKTLGIKIITCTNDVGITFENVSKSLEFQNSQNDILSKKQHIIDDLDAYTIQTQKGYQLDICSQGYSGSLDVKSEPPFASPANQTVIVREKYVIIINEFPGTDKILDQILSTFRFTK